MSTGKHLLLTAFWSSLLVYPLCLFVVGMEGPVEGVLAGLLFIVFWAAVWYERGQRARIADLEARATRAEVSLLCLIRAHHSATAHEETVAGLAVGEVGSGALGFARDSSIEALREADTQFFEEQLRGMQGLPRRVQRKP